VRRIVLVEDEPSVAAYFTYVLERLGGFTVDRASTGEEVLSLAQDPDTIAVVLDATLRSFRYQGRAVDGVTVARLIKDSQETSGLPVILASARVMPGNREQLLSSSGADGFLPKPLENHQQLLDLVAKLTAVHAPHSGRP